MSVPAREREGAMWRALLTGMVIALVGWGLAGEVAAAKVQPPTVELERVEVASYFPYAEKPARVPMVLAFIFKITNPNRFTVALEDLKFTYGFEAKPREFFDLSTPTVYDRMHIPGRASNQLRVVSVLDSLVVPSTLAVSAGFRVQALDLKIPDLVKMWWEQIGDFSFGIRVTEGVAAFASDQGVVLTTFDGMFPTR
jgi:hypothetical protein